MLEYSHVWHLNNTTGGDVKETAGSIKEEQAQTLLAENDIRRR